MLEYMLRSDSVGCNHKKYINIEVTDTIYVFDHIMKL